MRTLIIETQYCENYAAHNEGYEHGVDETYWKFKGGTTHFVTDISVSDEERIEREGIPTLTSLLEYEHATSKEYVIGYHFRDLGKDGDGGDPITPAWETPVEMSYDGDHWIARTHRVFDDEDAIAKPIIARSESWTMAPKGVRKDYVRSYKTPQGWFRDDDPALQQQVSEAAA